MNVSNGGRTTPARRTGSKFAGYCAAFLFLILTAGAGAHRPFPPGYDPKAIPPGPPPPKGGIPKTLPFFDNMETGNNGWTAYGFWHQVTNPQNLAVSPVINPRLVHLPDVAGQLPSSFSGSTCWWYGEDATGTFIGPGFDPDQPDQSGGTSIGYNYGNLYSPLIDLTSVSAATLSLKTWWEIEGVDANAFDVMEVLVSTDGGVNFFNLGSGFLNPIDDVNGEAWRPYSSGGLGAPGQWINAVFDLTPYVGHSIYLRFYFGTGDELYNGFRGWFIDDVSVTGTGAPAPHIDTIVPSTSPTNSFVHLNGTNFMNGATVFIAGATTATASVISSELAQIYVPPGVPVGPQNVTIINPDGKSHTLTNGLTITSIYPPSINSITPNSGSPNVQTPVTISGTNFLSGATASVAGTPLTGLSVVDVNTITGTIPSGLPLGYQNVTVTNPDTQTATRVGGYRVFLSPPVVLLNPGSQKVNAGQNVALFALGDGRPPITYQWMKDNQPVNGETNPELLLAPVAAGQAGLYRCDITNPDATVPTYNANLTVHDPPHADTSSFLSTSLPGYVFAGQDLIVGITFTNTSDQTWSQTQGYELRITSDPANIVTSLRKAGQKQIIIPDATLVIPSGSGVVQFVADFKAPATTGDYPVQAQMVENSQTAFGPTASLVVKVRERPNASEDWTVFE